MEFDSLNFSSRALTSILNRDATQEERYEFYRRSSFPKPAVKRVRITEGSSCEF